MGRIGAVAALYGALAVALGAFGAHSLQSVFSPDQLATWDTASRYLMAHALAALIAAYAGYRKPATAMLLGAGLFSGSLFVYLLAGWRPLVFVTPIGGLLMVASWLWMAHAIWHRRTAQ